MNTERLVNEFIELVKISSVTKSEGRFAGVLLSKLNELGFETFVDDAGTKAGSDTGNIIGRLKGHDSIPPVLFCAHMDTVVPGENIKPQIRDGVIYSDGTTILGADDKAGIAAILEAVRHIKENNIPHGDIEVAFTIYEEGGLYGAKNLDRSKINSKIAFVLDSGGAVGNVIVQGPAQNKVFVKIIGKAAHAGVAPEEGISAIQVAAKAINNMKLLRIDNETTANVGIIKGGQATNIVCDCVEIAFEARSLKKEKLEAQTNHIIDCIKMACSEFGAKCDIQIEYSYPEFSVDKNDEIIKITEKALEKIGLTCYPGSTGGGSDTNILNSYGIKTITLGIGMEKVHTTSEHISIESLLNTSRLVASIIQTL